MSAERQTPPPPGAQRPAPAATSADGLAEAANGLWDQLVAAVAARVLAELPAPDQAEWLDVAGAAAHLCCSKHRLYRLVSMRRIPHHHEGARLLFSRAELDAWVRGGGAQ